MSSVLCYMRESGTTTVREYGTCMWGYFQSGGREEAVGGGEDGEEGRLRDVEFFVFSGFLALYIELRAETLGHGRTCIEGFLDEV